MGSLHWVAANRHLQPGRAAVKTFYILDGHSQIYRAYFAPFRDLTSPAGEPTRATYVFTTSLLGLLERHRPDYLAMALDSPVASLERTQSFPQYKATRPAPPEDFAPQERRIVEIVQALGIPIWRGDGAEADDYLASAVQRFAGPDMRVVLVSRDKDLEQLLGPFVAMYDPMNDETIDPDALAERKGYRPEQALEVQTLIGDTVDNIPGVKGVGPKTAVKLIEKYGTAQAVVAHADEQTPKLAGNLRAFAEQLPLTRRLIELRRDLELPTALEACEWHGVDLPAVKPIFEQLGFHRLIERLERLAAERGSPESAPPAPAEAPAPEAAPGEPVASSAGPRAAADCDLRLIDTPEALDALAQWIREEKVTRLSVDTETTSRRPMWAELVGLSLSWRPGVGYYVPVRGPLGATVLELDRVRAVLGPILADAAIAKVGQNLKYDAIVLANAAMPLGGVAFDTYLAGYVLDPSASNKLDNLAQQYLQYTCIPIQDLIGTGTRAMTMDQVPTEQVATYAAEDAEVSLRLADALEPQLAEKGLAELFGRVEMPLLSVLVDMERTGIALDLSQLKRQELELDKAADVLRDRIFAAAGEPFNPDSPKQLAEVLFEKLRLPVIRRTKTGPSTDAEVLDRLAAEHELPALVLEYRQLTKLLGTYLRALAEAVHPATGRVHCSFNQGGTVTGRLSSSDPNLQNIPIRTEMGRRIRSAFVADAGFVLLSADYSQVELRILAHLSGDETLRAAFEANQDIHRTVAAEVFGVPADEVTPEQRARAKGVNFGIVYGQTAFGLSQALRIGRGEAQEFIDRYRARFPRIESFLAECIAQAKRTGYVETILKRRRPIAEIDSRNQAARSAAERYAINSVVQGSAADLIKLAMVNIHRRLAAENRPSRMLLQIHDELVFELPTDAVEPERAMIVQEMESALQLSVPLRVDTGVGENWMDAK